MGLRVGDPPSFTSCMCIKLAKLVLPFAFCDIPVFFPSTGLQRFRAWRYLRHP